MKILHIKHQFRDLQNYFVTSFFNSFYNKLVTQYSDIQFKITNEPQYENNGYGSIYSCMNMSIENPETKNYVVISFFDNWKYHFMHHLGWRPSNMKQFFYCGGFNYIDYFNFRNIEKNNEDINCPLNIKDIYKPFFYNPYYTDYDSFFTNIYQSYNIQNSQPKLYFRGYMWDFRKQMVANIKEKDILIFDKNEKDNHLLYEDYLLDLSKYRVALSLPGGTEICNRDIECFAIGVPVMRPHLDINYTDPLIPNYHYIDCFQSCKYWHGMPHYLSYETFAEYVEYYWRLIKNNIEYLEFISHNARNWYTKNCTMENSTQYIFNELNLEIL